MAFITEYFRNVIYHILIIVFVIITSIIGFVNTNEIK